jgi:hypothetical protein
MLSDNNLRKRISLRTANAELRGGAQATLARSTPRNGKCWKVGKEDGTTVVGNLACPPFFFPNWLASDTRNLLYPRSQSFCAPRTVTGGVRQVADSKSQVQSSKGFTTARDARTTNKKHARRCAKGESATMAIGPLRQTNHVVPRGFAEECTTNLGKRTCTSAQKVCNGFTVM